MMLQFVFSCILSILFLSHEYVPAMTSDTAVSGRADYRFHVLQEGHNTFSIYFRGDETVEVFDNPNDAMLEVRKNYRAVLIKPYCEFYYNRATGECMKMKKLDEDLFIRTMYQDEETQEWTLLGDTMTIKGYLCYKATRYSPHWGYELEAWYCPDLNINAAPYYYRGLPGLLVKSNQGELTELHLGEVERTLKPQKGDLVSPKKFKRKKSKTAKESNRRPTGF